MKKIYSEILEIVDIKNFNDKMKAVDALVEKSLKEDPTGDKLESIYIFVAGFTLIKCKDKDTRKEIFKRLETQIKNILPKYE